MMPARATQRHAMPPWPALPRWSRILTQRGQYHGRTASLDAACTPREERGGQPSVCLGLASVTQSNTLIALEALPGNANSAVDSGLIEDS